MTNPIPLKAIREGDRILLVIPDVGLFTAARPAGQLLCEGGNAGYLVQLGVGRRLVVPPGVVGRIANERPEKVHCPVGFGDVIYELEPIESGPSSETSFEGATDSGTAGLVLRSPHTGRFWHRPSPDDPAFCSAGDELSTGDAIGLIEIMKTFTQIGYEPASGLPPRARVLAVLAEDGADVTEGDPLIEVEPA